MELRLNLVVQAINKNELIAVLLDLAKDWTQGELCSEASGNSMDNINGVTISHYEYKINGLVSK